MTRGVVNFEYFHGIPTWTSAIERRALFDLAVAVPAGGLIVEIGALYGGSTSLLALANKDARVVTMDRFFRSPLADRPPATAAALRAEMERIGAMNVKVIEGDSRVIGPTWTEPINLLFVDGGHWYEEVWADLKNFGKHARVIAVHDYGDKEHASVQLAVDAFLKTHHTWSNGTGAGTLVILENLP